MAIDVSKLPDKAPRGSFGLGTAETIRAPRPTDTPAKEFLSPAGQVARKAKGVASGVVGTAGSMAGIPAWLEAAGGFDTPVGRLSERVANKIQTTAQQLAPADPDFSDLVAQGFGSMGAFFVPGLASARVLSGVARIAPGLALTLGSSASAIMEAATEAADSFESLRGSLGEDEAAKRANAVFFKNLPLLLATNKLGPFAEKGGIGQRFARTALTEGVLQEGPQDIFQQQATGQPINLAQTGTAIGVGSVVGGGVGGLTGLATRGRNLSETLAGTPQAAPQPPIPPTAAPAVATQRVQTVVPPLRVASIEKAKEGLQTLRQQFPQYEHRLARVEGGFEIRSYGTPGKEGGVVAEPRGRPAINSSPAFRNWFGESKVVDEKGKPMVVYHGTTEQISEFKPSPGVRMGILGSSREVTSPAFFFTANKEVADFFASNRADYKFDRPWLGKTMEVFLKMENPIDLTVKSDATINKLKKAGVDVYKIFGHRSMDYVNNDFASNLAASATDLWQLMDDPEIVGKLKAAGYDGAILAEGHRGKLEGDKRRSMGKSYAVFDPTQIKSAIGNKGTFDPKNPSIVSEPRSKPKPVEPWHYSALERAIEQRMPNAANPQQVLGILKNTPGVKQEEIEELEIPSFLEGKQKVSKEELLSHIQAHNVQLEEVVKGDNPKLTEARETVAKRELGLESYDLATPDEKQEIDDIISNEFSFGPELDKSSTKFQSYQLPGGENYRELLLKLPEQVEKGSAVTPELLKRYDELAEKMSRTPSEQSEFTKLLKLRNQDFAEGKGEKPSFQSSHFDEPNILAHVRMNDRVDAEGKKVLFIEEVQSDWHQKGKREGYRGEGREPKLSEGWTVRQIRTGEWQVVDERGYAQYSGATRAEALDELAQRQQEMGFGAVPDAPFKKTWHELALKRMIRYASENGYDRLAWTTGEQQAERYDLSRVISRLNWYLQEDGNYRITADQKDGGIAIDEKVVSPDKLPDLVGKEVAEKIVKGEGKRTIEDDEKDYKSVGTLSGLQLKVGGEGMKGFYDQILPAFLNKYTKKWGGRVSETAVKTKEYDKWTLTKSGDTGRWWFFDENSKKVSPYFTSKSSAEKWKAENGGRISEQEKVHSLEITPAMRQAVLGEGQPLFEPRTIPPKPIAGGALQPTKSGQVSGSQGILTEPRKRRIEYAKSQYEEKLEDIRRAEESNIQFREPRREVLPFGSPVTVAKGIADQLSQAGRIEYRGLHLSQNTETLAQITQVFRDPRFETFRIFLTKAGRIVSHWGITSGEPGSVDVKPLGEQSYEVIAEAIRKTGADGFYLQHNHPSGYPDPSEGDIEVNKELVKFVEGKTSAKFQGHVIIDHKTYYTISRESVYASDKDYTTGVRENLLRGVTGQDPLHTPSVNHPLLGRHAVTTEEVAQLGLETQSKKGYTTLFFISRGYLNGIQRIPTSTFRNLDLARKYIRAQQFHFGAQDVKVHTEQPLIRSALIQLVKERVLNDAVVSIGKQPLSVAGSLGIDTKKGAYPQDRFVVSEPKGEPPSGMQPRLKLERTEDITSEVERLINREPNDPVAAEQFPRLFRRISMAMRQGRINASDIPSFRDLGMSNEEAAAAFEQAVTFSGQTMNRLSQVAKEINKIAPGVLDAIGEEAKRPLTVWDHLSLAPKKVVNLWRASLVSQLATAVRNFAVFQQRFAFHVIEDAANGAYETVTGNKASVHPFGPMLEDLAAYARAMHPGNRERVLNLISQTDPLLREKLWRTPVGDVSLTNKYARLIGTFNSAQEYFARTIIVDAVMAGELRRAGITGNFVPRHVARKAVDRSLEITFAAYPRSKFGQNFIRQWNNPFMNILTYPFPRYLTNAVRAIWEYSPAGAMRLIHPKYWKILSSGDPRAAVEIATRAALGSALWALASWLRNSDWAGEKWYELKTPDGRYVDMRVYGPLLPAYLFIAQAVKDPSKFGPTDWIEGTLGVNRMAGTTLFITSVFAEKNIDSWKKALTEFSGQFAGGFTIPLRTFQDFVAQFSEEDRKVRDVRQQPLTGPAISNIPFASRSLPERKVLTRGSTIERESPMLRQLTGITLRDKSPVEKELDRLGIKPYELSPRLGETSIESAIIKRMGPKVERQMNAIVESPLYKRADDDKKADFLKAWFSDLRSEKKEEVLQQEPETVAAPYREAYQSGSVKQKQELAEKLKRKGLLKYRVPLELLRN